jgi:hypothetical protein
VRAPLPRLSLRETRAIVSMVKYHFRRDRSAARAPRSSKRLDAIHRLGIRRRWMIVRTLGCTLGEAIYQAYRAGTVGGDEIIDLLRDRFEAPRAARTRYRDLVARVRPYRGHGGTFDRGASPGA